MSYIVKYSEVADRAIAGYKKSNRIAYEKTLRLIKEITEHPRTGTGHPEPLTRENNVRFSRRISANDRIIYDIYDDTITVVILSAGGHYGDK